MALMSSIVCSHPSADVFQQSVDHVLRMAASHQLLLSAVLFLAIVLVHPSTAAIQCLLDAAHQLIYPLITTRFPDYYNANNGHWYGYDPNTRGQYNYDSALSWSESQTYQGVTGHLLELDDSTELDFLIQSGLGGQYFFLNAQYSSGHWYFMDGPLVDQQMTFFP